MDFVFEPQIFGYMAGIFTTLSFLPQAIKTLKTRDTQAISLLMYVFFVIGVFFWLAYGIVLDDNALIFANVVTFVFASPILVLKIIHIRRAARLKAE